MERTDVISGAAAKLVRIREVINTIGAEHTVMVNINAAPITYEEGYEWIAERVGTHLGPLKTIFTPYLIDSITGGGYPSARQRSKRMTELNPMDQLTDPNPEVMLDFEINDIFLARIHVTLTSDMFYTHGTEIIHKDITFETGSYGPLKKFSWAWKARGHLLFRMSITEKITDIDATLADISVIRESFVSAGAEIAPFEEFHCTLMQKTQ